MTGWAMLGLEASQTNPLDVAKGGRTPVSYLRSEVDRLRSVGDLERTILALSAAGIDPRSVRRRGPGRRPAPAPRRRRLGRRAGQPDRVLRAGDARRRSADALAAPLGGLASWRAEQRRRLGDPTARPRARRTPAAPRSRPWSPPAREDPPPRAGPAGCAAPSAPAAATPWAEPAYVNSQSTAWAVQGLAAVGGEEGTINRAVAYLSRLRAPDGHYRYSASSDQTPIWVTAQVLLAIERKPFPLAAVRADSAQQPRRGHGLGRRGWGRGELRRRGGDPGDGAGPGGRGRSAERPGGGVRGRREWRGRWPGRWRWSGRRVLRRGRLGRRGRGGTAGRGGRGRERRGRGRAGRG